MSDRDQQIFRLYSYCQDFAGTMLREAGDFYPFGAAVDQMGEAQAFGASNGDERPEPRELYRMLEHGFSAGAKDGSFSIVALAANVNVPHQYNPPFPDGLRIHLEAPGFSRYIYVPYVARGEPGKAHEVTFAEPITVGIQASFFSGSGA